VKFADSTNVSPKIKDRIEGRRFLFVKGRKLTMSAFYTEAREGASCGSWEKPHKAPQNMPKLAKEEPRLSALGLFSLIE
jgi:hypothetical protein